MAIFNVVDSALHDDRHAAPPLTRARPPARPRTTRTRCATPSCHQERATTMFSPFASPSAPSHHPRIRPNLRPTSAPPCLLHAAYPAWLPRHHHQAPLHRLRRKRGRPDSFQRWHISVPPLPSLLCPRFPLRRFSFLPFSLPFFLSSLLLTLFSFHLSIFIPP